MIRRLVVVASLIATLAIGLGLAHAQQMVTVSTNNTPIDRQVLEAITREALKRLGLGFRLINQPSERSLRSANLGQVDGEGLRVEGLESQYPNLIRVPEKFERIAFVAFAKDPSIRLDQAWRSLEAHRVGFITGWKLFEQKASGVRTLTKVDRPEQLFMMLDADRIDLALYTKADGVALARSMNMPQIVALGPPLKEVDMYLYLNKRHASLVPELAASIRALKADGSYARIMSEITGE
ncbi:MAG: transporter substrate-binding domain-containing protein [Rhodocyclaceae bacterium]|nr:transporter substrate-binding domain-containing protein [Rhodocyclaceae bacterium]